MIYTSPSISFPPRPAQKPFPAKERNPLDDMKNRILFSRTIGATSLALLVSAAGAITAPAQVQVASLIGRQVTKPAIVFLVAGQSNANGCGVLEPAIHEESGEAKRRPLVAGTTAREMGLSIDANGYTHSFIWVPTAGEFQAVDPRSNLHPPELNKPGHGMELPVVAELEKRFPENDIFVIKYAKGGSNLHRQWNPDNTSEKTAFYSIWLKSFCGGMAQRKRAVS